MENSSFFLCLGQVGLTSINISASIFVIRGSKGQLVASIGPSYNRLRSLRSDIKEPGQSPNASIFQLNDQGFRYIGRLRYQFRVGQSISLLSSISYHDYFGDNLGATIGISARL